ncbi:MAG: hypothetical protein KJT03_18000, partial [Verrucomicrobiae bacterium]|nr:hypothetical protein [Verrucomicrobiae bacterium]
MRISIQLLCFQLIVPCSHAADGGINLLQPAADALTAEFVDFTFTAERGQSGSFLSIAFPEVFSESAAVTDYVSGAPVSQNLEVRANGGPWLTPTFLNFNFGSIIGPSRRISFNMSLDGNLVVGIGDTVEVRGSITIQDEKLRYPDLVNTVMPVTIGPGVLGSPIFSGSHEVVGPVLDYLINFGSIGLAGGKWNNISATQMNSSQFI